MPGAPADTAASGLRLGAYVLIGDPAHLERSLASYYDIVERIVAVYDEDGIGWNGHPLALDTCRTLIDGVDRAGKVQWLGGSFHEASVGSLELDTRQRRAGIAALDDVDWVLQLDTDEVLGNPERFVASLQRAQDAGRDALLYPARWIYGHLSGDRYLERCRRLWGISATFPGPVAVRAGTQLGLARQCEGSAWRVDFGRHNTDPAYEPDTVIDERVSGSDAIWHFSWDRSEEAMRRKGISSGHAGDFAWNHAIDEWLERRRHPWRTTLGTPLRRRPPVVGGPTWLRVVRLPERVTG
ncbi:MAG: hypothetical protein ABSC56_01685 [Solirubrobacteraceae bacterium]|jgi:hypothetical protein